MLELLVATGDPLDVRTYRVREAISEPFDVAVVARTADAYLDLDQIVGRPATLRVHQDVGEGDRVVRRWVGVCRFAEQTTVEQGGLSTYAFQIVPPLWLMTQRTNYRIFHHLTALDIATLLLKDWQIRHRGTSSSSRKLPYKVQYGESDFAFVSRILEEAGLSYTCEEDDEERPVVAFSDSMTSGASARSLPFVPTPRGLDQGALATDVRVAGKTSHTAASIRDVDMRRPAYELRATSGAGRARYDDYRPGAFLVDEAPSGGTPVADAGGAARHDGGAGAERAERLLAGLRADREEVRYRTNAIDLKPGSLFELEAPHAPVAKRSRLLAHDQEIHGRVNEHAVTDSRAVFADSPFRPPAKTPRPRARIQSATVVGSGETQTDEFGRVRVHFPWDRERRGHSCWLRVSQPWAGAGYGMFVLPRVNQEVLVDFDDGDPEQPFVVGRVFNQVNPVVERLPLHETRGIWKGNSTPATVGFNQIVFEDKKGAELLLKHAERDARRLVGRDETATVVKRRHKTVARNETEAVAGERVQEARRDRAETTLADGTTSVGADAKYGSRRERIERVEGEEIDRVGRDTHVHVAHTHRELVARDASHTIGGQRPELVRGTDSLIVGGQLQEAVGSYSVIAGAEPHGWIHLVGGPEPGGKIVIEADVQVTVKAGDASFVDIKSGVVTIRGPEVTINESNDGPGSLPGPGPRPPEPPRMAVVAEPPPPPVVVPDTPLVTYELVVVDEWKRGIGGLDFAVSTPTSTTTERTDGDGRIVVHAHAGGGSAYAKDPSQLNGALVGAEEKPRIGEDLPTGGDYQFRTPSTFADTVLLPEGKSQTLMVICRIDVRQDTGIRGWRRRRLLETGPFLVKDKKPPTSLELALRSDATRAEAVVVGHAKDTHRGEDDIAEAGAPGESSHAPEWLRTVVDELHDALFRADFDAAFRVLEQIPLRPPPRPQSPLESNDASEAAYEAALAKLLAKQPQDKGGGRCPRSSKSSGRRRAARCSRTTGSAPFWRSTETPRPRRAPPRARASSTSRKAPPRSR